MTEITSAPAAEVTDASTDALLVTADADGLSPAARAADAALGGALEELRESGELTGGFGERTTVHTLGRLGVRRVVVLGIGDPAQLDGFRVHNAFQLAGAELRRVRAGSVTVHLDGVLAAAVARSHDQATMVARTIDTEAAAAVTDAARATAHRCAVTGLLAANFDGDLRRSERDAPPTLESLHVVTEGGLDAATVADAVALARAANQVRTWATEPSNLLTPTRFSEQVRALAEGTDLSVEVMDRSGMQERGMGALLGVASGSAEAPALVTVRHAGGRPGGPTLALVGKGITFDTGGISIKPAAGMEMMKYDMGGAAAVLAAVQAIAELGIAANVIAVTPLTENMPGGAAYKPGDVLTAMDGTTIEITNTDAEGRVVLSDALLWARDQGATHLVDVATLTGAVVVALGHVATGMMGNHRGLLGMVARASARGGERVVELPLHPEYDVVLKSEVADLKNAGGRQGGSLSGGVFLRRFVGDLPWVHLDIAGSAWNDQGDQVQIPKGPSGSPVRTLVELARGFAALEG